MQNNEQKRTASSGNLKTKLVEKLDSPPAGKIRRWTFRDDNSSHYHNRITGDLLPVIALSWRKSKAGKAHFVGFFRFHLQALMRSKFVKRDKDGTPRLRIQREGDELEVARTTKTEGHPFATISEILRTETML